VSRNYILSQRCTIRRYSITKDAGGGQVKSLASEWSQWCSAEQRPGGELNEQGQRQVDNTFRVIIRVYSAHPVYTSDHMEVNGYKTGRVISVAVDRVGDVRYYTLVCSALQ
jgi:SPP1 family predicted phage head-tail adaptor